MLTGWLLACGLAPLAMAGVTVYDEGDKKVEVGGRIQVQYLHVAPDGGDSQDETFLRRLRFYISGSVTKNWLGKIQADFGKSFETDEVAVKAVMQKCVGVM